MMWREIAWVHGKDGLVEAGTGGGIDVELFGGGQLGSEVENGKEAQLGNTVQSAVMSSGAMSSFFKGNYSPMLSTARPARAI